MDNFKLKGVAVILKDQYGQIFLGERHDDAGWCFPGGKIEKDEDPFIAAVRELYEETGILADGMLPIGLFTSPKTNKETEDGYGLLFKAVVDFNDQSSLYNKIQEWLEDHKEFLDGFFMSEADINRLRLYPGAKTIFRSYGDEIWKK